MRIFLEVIAIGVVLYIAIMGLAWFVFQDKFTFDLMGLDPLVRFMFLMLYFISYICAVSAASERWTR